MNDEEMNGMLDESMKVISLSKNLDCMNDCVFSEVCNENGDRCVSMELVGKNMEIKLEVFLKWLSYKGPLYLRRVEYLD